MAVRACVPLSANTSQNRLEQPSITNGWRVKPAGIHQSEDLNDASHPIQATETCLHHGKKVKAHEPCKFLGLLRREVLSHYPLIGLAVVIQGRQTRQEEEPSCLDGGHEACHGSGGWWKSNAELGKTLSNSHRYFKSEKAVATNSSDCKFTSLAEPPGGGQIPSLLA